MRRKALSTKLNAVVAPGGYLAEFARSLSDEVLRPHLKKIGGAAALFILGEITKSFLRKPFVWSQVGTPVERLAGIVIEVVAAVIIIGGWAMISASGLYLWRYLNATVGEWLKK